MTTPLDTESKARKKESPGKEIVFTGTLEEVNRYFADAGWSDGLGHRSADAPADRGLSQGSKPREILLRADDYPPASGQSI